MLILSTFTTINLPLKEIKNIGFIGAGNVAENLAIRLHNSNFNIAQILSRNPDRCKRLVDLVAAEIVSDFNDLDPGLDLLIIATPDDSIEKIASGMDARIPVVHTSGSVGIDALSASTHYGSVYPLQTLTSGQVDEKTVIPFLIEASSEMMEKRLVQLASAISANVSICSSDNRRKLHLAAVIVNNFTNHLYAGAEKFCHDSNIDFNLLKPLILETARKPQKASPASVQTGPAKRKDHQIIEQHLQMLSDNQELHEIYRLLTDQIIKTTL